MTREMRDSGQIWVGDIPADWGFERIGAHFSEVTRKNADLVSTNALKFTAGSIVRKPPVNDVTPLLDTYSTYKVVDTDDMVINCLNLNFDLKSFRVGRVEEPGIITSAYLVLRPDGSYDPRFVDYAFKAFDYRKALHNMGTGLRKTLNWKEFKQYRLQTPPIDEQRRIADYLDAKCAKIDHAIEAAERSIEELTIYRRAVVSKVLHWGDWPMTHVGVITTKVGSGKTPRGGREVYVSEGVPIIRSQNVRDEGIRLDDVAFITEETDATMASTHVLTGDLLLNITGASIGRSCVAPDDLGTANVNQHVCIVRPVKSIVCAEWLHQCWYSEHGQRYVMTTQVGATREALNSSQIKAFRIPLPPLSEQKRLSGECDVTGARVDTLIAAKQSIIEDLKAYKQSLVYEVVTGKREV